MPEQAFCLSFFERAPKKVILDFDLTDCPVYGDQAGKFFHGYYKNSDYNGFGGLTRGTMQ